MNWRDQPAFPQTEWAFRGGDGREGMTLRDWFAGQALAGMMSNEDMPFAADYAEVKTSQIANAVFAIADAMLSARQTGGEA